MNRRLLHTPEGVRDRYGSMVANRRHIREQILSRMRTYGYAEIEPPTLEYFDVFSGEMSTTSARKLYKFSDAEGNTLVLRPDFTPSVARCVSKYFAEGTDAVRLCYAGQTFLNGTGLQGKLREVTELGAELMNEGSVAADAEIIALLIETLQCTGLKEFIVSIGDADYYKGICEEAGIDEETEAELRDALTARNYHAAERLIDDLQMKEQLQVVLMLSELVGDESVIDRARQLVTNARSLAAIDRLDAVYRTLADYGIAAHISFDLGNLSHFNYYTGITFRAFARGVGDAVARGGRYDRLLSRFGKDTPAIGFMISLDDLMSTLQAQGVCLPEEEKPQIITYEEEGASFRQALTQARELRAQGHPVILQQAGKGGQA
ncbi:MAG: ATP phosphoribosyltransferase regulatory subunit [Butyrivibrio sp.]|nr:ATP phosphoribosyltransferase regulatory subunit [Butyrivibrio sp.]